MKKAQHLLFVSIILLTGSLSGFAQKDSLWHLNATDSEEAGIDYAKAINYVSNRPMSTIVVAVIDDGVNVKHPDLKSVVWTNPDEIVGNGVDDDKNGYIDDVYGWNFIGKTKGDNLEKARYIKENGEMYRAMKGSEKKADENYDEFKAAAKDFKKERKKMVKQAKIVGHMDDYMSKVKDKHGMNPTWKEAKKVRSKGLGGFIGKRLTKRVLKKNPESFGAMYPSIHQGAGQLKEMVDYHYNPELDERADNVGDNYSDVTEKYYGDNKVNYWSSGHGTHVAGIIAADASNDFGAKGICNTCKIMSVRTVPNGDERDKDVANSIIYAVDNGAKVINMSFGKSMSPHLDRVQEAIKYAENNDVLLVHAAGNNSSNNDEKGNFPNDKIASGANWIEVGASSFGSSPTRLARFSNYGKSQVDLFAPGHMIYSTYTDNDYKAISGTSMASPVVAGVAAFVWSYFPDLTAAQIKQVLLKSATKVNNPQQIPGSKDLENLSELCVTGGIVNLFGALKEAEKVSLGL